MYHKILIPSHVDFIDCTIYEINCTVGQRLKKDEIIVEIMNTYGIGYPVPFECIVKSIDVVCGQNVTCGTLVATIESIDKSIKFIPDFDINDNRVIWHYQYDFTGWSMDVYKVIQIFVKIGDIVKPKQLIATIEIEADNFNQYTTNRFENIYSHYTGEVVDLGRLGEMGTIFSLLIDPSEYQNPWKK